MSCTEVQRTAGAGRLERSLLILPRESLQVGGTARSGINTRSGQRSVNAAAAR